jgi:outer membrane receptor protein involved in Fe transport
MKHFLIISLLITTYTFSLGQMPVGMNAGRTGANRQNMNVGHFYGKVVDSKTNKGIAGVTIVLTGNKFDTVTKQMKQATLKTAITANNGDFSLENLPVFGNFKLKVSTLGYKSLEKQLSFGIKFPQGGMNGNGGNTSQDGSSNAGSGFQQLLGQVDKDLGNIKIEGDAADLGNVTVTSSAKQQLELGIDRKIFNVDKNLNSTGQTATEIMKNIPSVNVDIDGNVTLRNATPTIFVDGRPTTMTLDQIPADIIDKVEIITNPSAKYDASGGNAGILNIVLKKNKKNGYNGGFRLGVDSRGKLNGGGDINYRQNKFNFFASGMYMERKSVSTSLTNQVLHGIYNDSSSYTDENGLNNGHFGFGRGGFDYFIDNRNTISVTANYNKGHFDNQNTQHIDSSVNGILNSTTNRNTNSSGNFENFGGQLSFKHNFTQNGHDITADINYNSSNTNSFSNIDTYNYLPNGTAKFPLYQQQTLGSGYNHYFTGQTDYENQISENSKFEAGARAALREFRTDNLQYVNDNNLTHSFILNPRSSSKYKFNDNVYAAYANYSLRVKKWSYQLGLRVESSNYNGQMLKLNGADSTSFSVSYPVSLFPSAFITYKIDQKQDFQINYSRRINRPNFFQLIPSYDFTNPQSPSVGNPNLKPEFTNSMEVSYNNAYKRNANFLATVYFKYSTDLITRYTYKDIDRNTLKPNATDSLYYTSYINANNSYSYGIELTNKMPVTKWWDVTLNVNIYNAILNATLPNETVNNSLVSGFAKMNNNFKVAKGWSVQFSGDYQAKSLIPQNSGFGGGGRGGMMFGGGPQAFATGYILPRYGFDLSVRKDWTWKNGQIGSLTLSMNDIFRTQLYKTTASSNFGSEVLVQDVERRRDPQILRLNFSYRFGKFDVNLFKRKNTRADQSGGMDMMQQ